MASLLHMQGCFGVRYIFLPRWSLVPFRWLHKCAKLSCLENPHIFRTMLWHPQKNGVWYAMSCKPVIGPFLLKTTVTVEVCHDITRYGKKVRRLIFDKACKWRYLHTVNGSILNRVFRKNLPSFMHVRLYIAELQRFLPDYVVEAWWCVWSWRTFVPS